LTKVNSAQTSERRKIVEVVTLYAFAHGL